MSRNMRLLAALIMLVPLAAGAQAPADVQKEIAYRAALGRAADITLLIGRGANPNAANAEGIPLLLVAAGRKDSEAANVVQALLEGGASVNVKDKNGQTALYYAARAGKPDVVSYLLKNNIDYYSLDNNGDIARTIAFRAGHNDIVKIMDEFVKSQTIQAEATVRNAEELMREQQLRQQREAKEAAEKAALEQAIEEARAKVEQARKLAIYRENLKKLGGKVYDISYHACAFEYWSFCLAANQTSEISDEEMEEIVGIHKEEVQEASLEVMKMFEVEQAYVNKVIEPSKQAVFTQLNEMPSRTYRHQNGIGTLKDVYQRCRKIADSWVIAEPALPAADAPAAQPAPPAAAPQPAPVKAPAAPTGKTTPGPYPAGTLRYQDGKMVEIP